MCRKCDNPKARFYWNTHSFPKFFWWPRYVWGRTTTYIYWLGKEYIWERKEQ